ncbi:wall-associated receptor kinase galacturonan-binding protein, partial [Trifolium medium]|nr:wall-associated receptor kinase galacturonan-binding protein [Trifolium medium]
MERNQQLSSYDVIHKALVYGFEISWLDVPCKNSCGDSTRYSRCIFNSKQKLQCYDPFHNCFWGGDPKMKSHPCSNPGPWYYQPLGFIIIYAK